MTHSNPHLSRNLWTKGGTKKDKLSETSLLKLMLLLLLSFDLDNSFVCSAYKVAKQGKKIQRKICFQIQNSLKDTIAFGE